jgi:cytochrome P450
MPEDWSWWTGHLLVLQRHLDSLPSDANVYMAMQDLALKHNDTEVFLFDFWPVFDQVLMIYGPEASNQVSNQYNLPKPASQHKSMLPIVGGPSLISMNDKDWKFWRGLLNPGFSSKNMADRVPTVVAAVEVFCDGLRAKVDKSIFLLDDLTTRLTMDIITKATLYVKIIFNGRVGGC